LELNSIDSSEYDRCGDTFQLPLLVPVIFSLASVFQRIGVARLLVADPIPALPTP